MILQFYFAVALLDHLYWIAGSMLGGVAGALMGINTEGIEFAMTALFIVILIEQIKSADNRLPALLAFVSSIVCLILFGPSNFILPSLLITVALLTILRSRIEPEEKEGN